MFLSLVYFVKVINKKEKLLKMLQKVGNARGLFLLC